MSPVSQMSVPSSFLLLGLVLFVMFTLGRRRRTAGLVVVGLIGVVLCGLFLLGNVLHRVEVSSRHDGWNWQHRPPTVPAVPSHPRRVQEDQAILVVDLDADELEDEDVDAEELAGLAQRLCQLERHDESKATLSKVERIPLREGDERHQLLLERVGRVSRQFSGDLQTPETLRIVRFRCPDQDTWLAELQSALQDVPDGELAFLKSTFNRDAGTLDLVVETPAAHRLAAGHAGPFNDESLREWEQVFGGLHGPTIARAMRQEFEAKRQARSDRDAARAAVKDAIRESAELANQVIKLPVEAVREATDSAAAEAREAVASARAAAEEAADQAIVETEDQVIVEPRTPEVPGAPAPPVVAATSSGGHARPRPEWLDRPKEEKYESGYRRHVIAGPAGSLAECQRQLEIEIQTAVAAYVDSLLAPGAARQLDVSPEYIEHRIVKDKWQETHNIESLDPKLVATETEAGAMLSLHALLDFDQEVENEVKTAWRDYQVRGRLWAAGIGSIGVLGVVGALFGYLRLDTATKGYYSGRLKVATSAAILGVIAAVAGALALLLEFGFGPR